MLLISLLVLLGAAGGATAQSSASLRLPGGVAFDSQGNLFLSDTANHLVRKLTPSGVLSTVAGTGTQGFGGDGGAGTAALLDSPGPIAIDSAGNIFFGDCNNHRIRRIDAGSGLVSTVAGDGTSGSGLDGQLAAATALDLPGALAFDSQGDLYFSDVRGQVVRRIDHVTGRVSTVAGNGRQGLAGDEGSAVLASLDTPLGLAIDSSGNLYIGDTHNHRVRRVDAGTGIITTLFGSVSAGSLPGALALDGSGGLLIADTGLNAVVRVDLASGLAQKAAGTGLQGYLGDGSAATAAALNGPRALALSPAGLVTLADTGNGRIRQVNAAGIIYTLVGTGAITAQGLTLAGSSPVVYGTGSVTATLAGVAGSGTVTLTEGGTSVGVASLSANAAVFSTASLSAGTHTLIASYAGDANHPAAQSAPFLLTINAVPVVATVNSVSALYGQTLPILTGTLSGLLPQDASSVSLHLTSAAGSLSPAGTYGITGTLTGAAAGNYALSAITATIVIARAPSATSSTALLAVHVASSTSGTPTGSVALLDGGNVLATLTLSPTGDAQFSSAGLSNGSHTLSVAYSGDGNFLPSVSAPQIVTTGGGAQADFALAAVGSSSITVVGGSTATFDFQVTPTGAIPSQIVLSASGLPPGATASFSPAYLPPGSTVAPFALTIQTVKATALLSGWGTIVAGSLLLPLLLQGRRRRRLLVAAACTLALGCGDRVNTAPADSAAPRTYNITVNATATGASGATLLHSATVMLTIQ